MGTTKTSRILLPSALRTATAQSQTIIDPYAQVGQFYLNVTAASGTGGLTLKILGSTRSPGDRSR